MSKLLEYNTEISECNNIQKELQEIAYFNWLKAGKPEGRDLEFWCEAERIWCEAELNMFGYTMQEMDDAYEEYTREMLVEYSKEQDRMVMAMDERDKSLENTWFKY